jgi:hypothetical protein
MELSLTEAQITLMRELLESAIRDISYEIADTATPDYKQELRQRRELMVELKQSLEAAAARAAS